MSSSICGLPGHRFIFVARAEHAERFQLAALLQQLAPATNWILTDAVTGGPLENHTARRAPPRPDGELLVSYCDSYFTIELDAVLHSWSEAGVRRADLPHRTGRWRPMPCSSPMGASAASPNSAISGNAVAGLYSTSVAPTLPRRRRPHHVGRHGGRSLRFERLRYARQRGRARSRPHIRREQRIEMGTPADLEFVRHWLAQAVVPAFS